MRDFLLIFPKNVLTKLYSSVKYIYNQHSTLKSANCVSELYNNKKIKITFIIKGGKQKWLSNQLEQEL